jgi:UDP:flavonoid glycosyltransferase YjiC (YdhE family)
VIIHTGSAGMAMAGIAAGIPQVILTTDLEKTLIGHALAERNAATVLLWDEFDMLDLAVAIRKTEDSDVMQTAARNLSLENTRYLQLDAVGEIARNVTELLA